MRIGRLAPWLSLLVAPFSIAAPTTPPAAAPSAPLIPHEKFMLDNGLTVIVAPDHKAPIVAVNVWYHVGSKNERAGKTGFAHLFEHLMFQGSENFNDEYFKPFEQVGATSQNGTTSFDRTNYFQNVPTTARRSRDVDGIRSHGPPARRDRSAAARRAARRGAERKASEREPSVRPRLRAAAGRDVSGRTSLSLVADRLDGRSQRRVPRRRQGVVPDLLRRGERGARAGGRHRYAEGTRTGAEILRRHPAGSCDHAAADLDG